MSQPVALPERPLGVLEPADGEVDPVGGAAYVAHRDSPLTPKMSAKMSPGVAMNGSVLIGSYCTSR